MSPKKVYIKHKFSTNYFKQQIIMTVLNSYLIAIFSTFKHQRLAAGSPLTPTRPRITRNNSQHILEISDSMSSNVDAQNNNISFIFFIFSYIYSVYISISRG